MRFIYAFILLSFTSCKRDEPAVDTKSSGYPPEIAKIIIPKCANSGCHNSISKSAAAGLSLSTFDEMMQGGNNGAVTIPYFSKLSSTRLFTNTYDKYGVKIQPTMPLYAAHLSENEMETIINWIDKGAPNHEGAIKFSDDLFRKKAYITNQGCDIIAVLDLKTNLIMRYIEVGIRNYPEVPHTIKITPDGKYWCVCFASGDVFQIFSTQTDQLVASVLIPPGSWNTIAFSSDSKMAYSANTDSDGKIACINLQTFQLQKIIGSGTLEWPHGVAVYNDTVLYATCNKGNYLYRANISDLDNVDFTTVIVEKNAALNKNSSLDIHEMVYSPDKSKYFLSCQTSNEVRVMDATKDTLITVISTGKYPVEFSFSKKHHYLFVSCMEDITFLNEGIKGSITVIDYTNNSAISTIKSGFQPHGLWANDEQELLYVINRNISPDGPAPHHTSYCSGKNGYYNLIDMKTLQIVPKSNRELSTDPYSIAIRN